MSRVVLVVCSVIAAAALSGCGGKSCNDLCTKPCNGVTTAACQAQCVKTDALNQASGCTPKYNTMLGCLSGLSDADRCSTTNTLCKTEANAFIGCATDYCTAHPSDGNCQ